MKIPFNKPYFTGKETEYIKQAVETGKISGGGLFTGKCQHFFETRYGFNKSLLTSSCTDALEMAAILCGIEPGDEVIAPSFTFVSTVNAFVLRGAKIIFADSEESTPNIDVAMIEPLVTSKTKVIVPVHYAGMACNMSGIFELAQMYNLLVVEDAAQAVDSYYQGKPLGSLGHMATFSFHETKNVISGEGGMLVVNDDKFSKRSEIIWEKGTNRAAFFRGEVDKYGWVDIGSSFLPSDIIAAFLYAQLEHIDDIQNRRKKIWNFYWDGLKILETKGILKLPHIPEYATNNGHMFYLICADLVQRNRLIEYLKAQGIMAVFHYLSLHKSPFYEKQYDGRELPNSDRYSDCLLRLPLYYELSDNDLEVIIASVLSFFRYE
ncbi:MAG: dTDP-4-amino-4,6-dideoxygalactose transaminase [Desulfobacteraceae bacterium Eth-SRB1]|nr:MAG: dTDP-4-amino-4,6-dideoxygalactose transaminase [Desulfobacteraceae bacterium Eth-SRB1]